jgi:hypothetical protein
MTERTQNRKLAVFLFFGLVCAMFAYFVYFFVTEQFDPIWTRGWSRPAVNTSVTQRNGQYILFIDEEKTIGNLKITYRGQAAKAVLLDVVITDLDPDYAYLRQIPIEAARQQFMVGDQAFVVESSGSQQIKIAPADQ